MKSDSKSENIIMKNTEPNKSKASAIKAKRNIICVKFKVLLPFEIEIFKKRKTKRIRLNHGRVNDASKLFISQRSLRSSESVKSKTLPTIPASKNNAWLVEA